MSSRFNLSLLVAIFLLVSVCSAVAEEAEYASMDEIIELLEYCSSSLPDCTYSQPEKIELENGETRYLTCVHSIKLDGNTNAEILNNYVEYIKLHNSSCQSRNDGLIGDAEYSSILDNILDATRHCYLLLINPDLNENPFYAIFRVTYRRKDNTHTLRYTNALANTYTYTSIVYENNRFYAITNTEQKIQITAEKDTRDYNEFRKGFLAYIPILHIKNWNEMKIEYTINNEYQPTSSWAFHIEEDVNIDNYTMPIRLALRAMLRSGVSDPPVCSIWAFIFSPQLSTNLHIAG